MSEPAGPRRVLLTTEGTYPHALGGVSTWCQSLVESMPEIDFTVLALMMNPFVDELYTRPENCDLVPVPIWGVEEPAEFNEAMSPRRVIVLSSLMDERTAQRRFCPMLRELLEMTVEPERFDAMRFGQLLHAMYHYFREHDFRGTFRTRAVWETFRQTVLAAHEQDTTDLITDDLDPEDAPTPAEVARRFSQLRRLPPRPTAIEDGGHALPRLFEATESMRVLYRLLTPLNYDIPQADLVHATAAAFCGLPGIVNKIDHGTPFLVTEHGVFMREQMLFLGRSGYPFHLRKFFIQLVSAMSRTVYHYADQISPVCAYNARWEERHGATQDQIRIIYNGADPERFAPRTDVERDPTPTVVMVSRIDPLKDLETSLRVAAKVRERVPDVRFLHFGPNPDPDYDRAMRALWEELELQGTFEWRGATRDPAGAFNAGDVVLLTSISEAFPYTVIEAMMCGKPVVSTNVGGVPEALGNLCRTARLRDVEDLAEETIRLLGLDEGERAALSQACRDRAMQLFTIEDSIGEYRASYAALGNGSRRAGARPRPLPPLVLPDTEPAVAPPVATPVPAPVVVPDLPAPADATELRERLASPLPATRRAALGWALELLGPSESAHVLGLLLRTDPDPAVRAGAATQLGELAGRMERVS